MATNTKQAKKELRKTIKKYLNKVGKVSGNKEIEPYLSQAEAEINQQFDQATTTAVEEALGDFVKRVCSKHLSASEYLPKAMRYYLKSKQLK